MYYRPLDLTLKAEGLPGLRQRDAFEDLTTEDLTMAQKGT